MEANHLDLPAQQVVDRRGPDAFGPNKRKAVIPYSSCLAHFPVDQEKQKAAPEPSAILSSQPYWNASELIQDPNKI